MRAMKIMGVLAGILLVVGLAVMVNPVGLAEAFSQVPPAHVAAALLIVQAQVFLSAVRWRFTASRLGQVMPLWIAVREYYLAGVLNQLLPGGIAGDATRIYRNSDDRTGGWKRSATAVMLERLSGQVAFLALTCIGLLAWPLLLPGDLPANAPTGPLAIITVIALVMAGVAIATAWLSARVRQRIEGLRTDLKAVLWTDGAAVVQAVLSVLVVGTYVLVFLLASDAVGARLPLVAAVTAVPLCLLSMLIPIGIGGWGTREAAAAALWPVFGFTGAQGLAASLLYGLLSLAGAALPGLIILAWSMLRRSKTSQ